MKMIELHLLQSFPFTCLNRDNFGSPKTAYFGGVPRARVSSQCWKRAIRTIAFNEAGDYFAGRRGQLHSLTLSKKLVELGFQVKDAKRYALNVLESLCISDEALKKKVTKEENSKKQKNEEQTSAVLHFAPSEIEVIAEMIRKEPNFSGNVSKSFKAKITKALNETRRRDFGDIAIFGRMVAQTQELTLEGAALFSHALSTHEVSNEIDFFSAVDETRSLDDYNNDGSDNDDEAKSKDSAGAAHIGSLEANSACYYRYVGLNLDLLFGNADPKQRHLQTLDFEDKKTVLKVFLNAVMKANPDAHKNSMFGFSLPQFATAFVRKGQPLSLVNAFEIPVKVKRDGGYLEPSRRALVNHLEELNKIYRFVDESERYELNVDNPFDKWLDEIVAAALEGYK